MKLRLILFLCLAVPVLMAFKCSNSRSDGVFRGVVYNDVSKTTPMGVRVNSRTKIDPAMFPLIDNGLKTLFRIASNPPYNYPLSGPYPMVHGEFTVWLFDRSDKCINPAFLVDGSGTPYDQSEWDKDPRPGFCTLCAAGMMLGETGMLIPNTTEGAETIVRYEGEHNVLLRYDSALFAETQYHLNGHGHPILPDVGAREILKTVPHAIATATWKGKKYSAVIVK